MSVVLTGLEMGTAMSMPMGSSLWDANKEDSSPQRPAYLLETLGTDANPAYVTGLNSGIWSLRAEHWIEPTLDLAQPCRWREVDYS